MIIIKKIKILGWNWVKFNKKQKKNQNKAILLFGFTANVLN